MVYPVLLAPSYIPELHVVTQTGDGEFRSWDVSNSCSISRHELGFYFLNQLVQDQRRGWVVLTPDS